MKGYKVFYKGLVNKYGFPFEEGETYKIDTSKRTLKYGTDGNGFHFARRLEDGLRYFDGLNEELDIAEVKSSNILIKSYDDYYGYYDLYVTDMLKIEHVLTREEIIKKVLKMPEQRAKRFIEGYRLSEEEINIILNKFKSKELELAIDYYQKNIKDVYEKVYRKEYKYE